MPDLTRRRFIRNASIGAAAAGTAAAASGLGLVGVGAATTAAPAAPAADTAVPEVEGPIVAYVTDLANGVVSVFHGLTENVIVDHNLARAIATAVK